MVTRRPADNLPPGSQPWRRSIEADIDQLKISQTTGQQLDEMSLSGLSQSLRRVGDQVQILSDQQVALSEQQGDLETLTYQQSIVADDVYINTGPFPLTNTSWVTRGTVTMPVPAGAQFAMLLGNVSLDGGTSVAPPNTAVIQQQMTLTYVTSGTTQELIIGQFPSLVVPSNVSLPAIITSGGPISYMFNTANISSDLTFRYQTSANFSGYPGSGYVTAQIFALFFYRSI